MKRIYTILLPLLVFFSGCESWMDVQPKTSVREDKLFSTESGFTETLNGIYNMMQGNSCYGFELTMGLTEIMAQRWNIGKNHTFEKENAYDWQNASVKMKIDNIWKQLYKMISEINFLLDKMNDPEYKDVLSPELKKVIEGELYGLRGFFHLDILRLFGPMYNSEGKDKACLPYYDNFRIDIPQPMIPAETFAGKIIADLEKAEGLLTNEPVRTETFEDGILASKSETVFYSYRGLRMNYYAVKACKARALLYMGKNESAKKEALEVIDSKRFPFVKVEDITGAASPDRIFKTEIIFGVYNTKLKNNFENYFAQDGSLSFLSSTDKALNTIFENNTNDIRFGNEFWTVPINKAIRFFYKYSDAAEATSTQMLPFVIPLIRISEMYYIIAECDTDNGYSYLNDIRKSRRLGEANQAKMEDEIRKEYTREFWGEGQLLFYYKRKNTKKILLGDGSKNVSMNPQKYTLPIPESETTSRPTVEQINL